MVELTTNIKFSKSEMRDFIDIFLNNQTKKLMLYWKFSDVRTKVFFIATDGRDQFELEFNKCENYLLLNYETVETIQNEMKQIVISFLDKKRMPRKTKKHLQLEIDYALMELNEYITNQNARLIEETKHKLSELVNEMNRPLNFFWGVKDDPNYSQQYS